MEERKRKSMCRSNKFVPLLSKVCKRMEGGNMVCLYKGKAQPTRCWGYCKDPKGLASMKPLP